MSEESVLAVVDGDPITVGDMNYSLEVTHRKEDLSSAEAMDLSGFLETVVDDRLIAQEARRMGLEQLREVSRAVDEYVLRESVVMLYNEEIVNKISVTDEEARAHYDANYEIFTFNAMRINSEAELERVLEELKGGKDFGEVAKEHSGIEEMVFMRKVLGRSLDFEQAVIDLQPGELSDAIKIGDAYLILKLISREKPSAEKFEDIKGRVKSEVWKQKEKERTKEYLETLRQSADINIDEELLSDFAPEESEQWLDDDRPLVEVYDSVLTIGEFATMVRHGMPKEQVLDSWVDIKLVDHEALDRNYATETGLKESVRRYEDRLLKNTFIFRVIVPQVEVSEEELEEYFSNNRAKYVIPPRFKIQQITVKTLDEAQEVLESLKGGADFSWLAKTKSTDKEAFEGGDVGWKSLSELPEEVRDLQPGEISPIIEVGTDYRIIRVQVRTEEEPEKFENVKRVVYKNYFDEKVQELLDEYVAVLREEAEIEFYTRTVRSYEKMFKDSGK